jgi:hypothetical protein
VTTAAGPPDAPSPPEVHCKSPHVAVVSWTEPPSNGSAVTEYHLEWQMKDELDFVPVCSNFLINTVFYWFQFDNHIAELTYWRSLG